jgi:hypothetical protein
MQTLVDVVDIESGYLQWPRPPCEKTILALPGCHTASASLATLGRKPQREDARFQFHRRQERGDRRFRLAIES